MKKKIQIFRNDDAPATKADVREIVAEITTEIVSRELEKFAIMVKHGFDDILERMATKDDIRELRRDMGFLSDRTDSRFDDHEIRIERLEAA